MSFNDHPAEFRRFHARGYSVTNLYVLNIVNSENDE